MNPLDSYVITFLNQFAHRSLAFDTFVREMGSNYLLKTGLIMTLVFWVWFREDKKGGNHRETVVFGLAASCAAVLAARALSLATMIMTTLPRSTMSVPKLTAMFR